MARNKFAHETNRRRDIARKRGYDADLQMLNKKAIQKYFPRKLRLKPKKYCTEITERKAKPCRKLSRCLNKNKLEYETNNLCYNP